MAAGKPSARAPSRQNTEKFKNGYTDAAQDCLKARLAPLLRSAESKDTFMARIGELYPPTHKKYVRIGRIYDLVQREFKDKLRDDGEPYFLHLRATAIFAIDYLRERRAHVIMAILLHDLLEDLPEKWNFDRLVREVGHKTAELVWWVTKPDKNGRLKTDLDVDRSYYERLRRAPRRAIIIKLVDRLHNLTTIWAHDDVDRIRRKVDETKCYIMPFAREHQLLIHELEETLAHIEECLLNA